MKDASYMTSSSAFVTHGCFTKVTNRKLSSDDASARAASTKSIARIQGGLRSSPDAPFRQLAKPLLPGTNAVGL